MLKVVGGLCAALLLVALSMWWQRRHDEAVLSRLQFVTDSTLQVITVRNQRARDSLTAIRVVETTRADQAVASAHSKRASAALLKFRADSLQNVLASQTTAADSLPVVLQQRDGLRLAYDTLTVAFDSLLVAHGSLRTIVQIQDSLARLASDESAAREAALISLNRSLRLDLDRAQNRGKLLGIVRVPDWAKVLAGGVAGYLLKP